MEDLGNVGKGEKSIMAPFTLDLEREHPRLSHHMAVVELKPDPGLKSPSQLGQG